MDLVRAPVLGPGEGPDLQGLLRGLQPARGLSAESSADAEAHGKGLGEGLTVRQLSLLDACKPAVPASAEPGAAEQSA